MACSKLGGKMDDIDFTNFEIDRLTKCMKDEKFRDLLREYAEEISDPGNRKNYEEEITELEQDKGMDVKFINPKPGHVLKTSIVGKQKCFINICTNENLGQPRSRPSMQGNTRGMQWSIPHSVSQAREDVDKAGTECMVYDVVYHPDTYYLLKKNARFKKMIHDTALDAVERQFGVELDKVNVKTPKMTFKGLPMSSVIRTPHSSDPPELTSSSSMENVDVKLGSPFPLDETKSTNATKPKGTAKAQPFPNLKEEVKKAKQLRERARNGEPLYKDSELEWGFIEPEYSIMHRGHFDIHNHKVNPDVVYDTWPKELVINIDLPLLTAANCVNLEIHERRLRLDSVKPAKYKLDFELPYPVAENKGFAKFDKSRHRLTVTLEVLPAPPPPKLLPFTSPPQIDTRQTSTYPDEENKPNEHSSASKEGDATTKENEPQQSSGSGSNQKVGIEESVSVVDFNEATEATAETSASENSSVAKTKQTKKEQEKVSENRPPSQPTFLEEGRRHYQQGRNWKDDGDLEEVSQKSGSEKLFPLTKNSAFLIDMVMKYDGLIRRCPQYAFQQDEHFISFIVEVPHIFEESLWYAVYDNMLQLCCLSECLDDDMVNSVFQLWIEYEEGLLVDPQRSRVDVSGNNAVFCLRKVEPYKEWQTIKAGFDKDNLDVRRFSTAHNVCELYTLVYKHAIEVKTSPIAVCKVVREEKDLLILELEAKLSEDEASKPENEQKSSDTKGDAFQIETARESSVTKQSPSKDEKTQTEQNKKEQLSNQQLSERKIETVVSAVFERDPVVDARKTGEKSKDVTLGPANFFAPEQEEKT